MYKRIKFIHGGEFWKKERKEKRKIKGEKKEERQNDIQNSSIGLTNKRTSRSKWNYWSSIGCDPVCKSSHVNSQHMRKFQWWLEPNFAGAIDWSTVDSPTDLSNLSQLFQLMRFWTAVCSFAGAEDKRTDDDGYQS